MLAVDLAEVSLALAEPHRRDVHRALANQSERECLAANEAGTDRHNTVSGTPLRLRHCSRDVVEERYVRLGVPALGLWPVRHHEEVLSSGRLCLPAVGQVEQVPALDRRPDARPERLDVGQRGRGDTERGMLLLQGLVDDGRSPLKYQSKRGPTSSFSSAI